MYSKRHKILLIKRKRKRKREARRPGSRAIPFACPTPLISRISRRKLLMNLHRQIFVQKITTQQKYTMPIWKTQYFWYDKFITIVHPNCNIFCIILFISIHFSKGRAFHLQVLIVVPIFTRTLRLYWLISKETKTSLDIMAMRKKLFIHFLLKINKFEYFFLSPLLYP